MSERFCKLLIKIGEFGKNSQTNKEKPLSLKL